MSIISCGLLYKKLIKSEERLMFDEEENEELMITSITIKPTINQKLKFKALEKGFKSRNHLINHILEDWIKKEK